MLHCTCTAMFGCTVIFCVVRLIHCKHCDLVILKRAYLNASCYYYYYYYYYKHRIDHKGKHLLKKATLRGIGDVRGKGPVCLNELSLNFRRKLLIYIAQISSLV